MRYVVRYGKAYGDIQVALSPFGNDKSKNKDNKTNKIEAFSIPQEVIQRMKDDPDYKGDL